MGYIAGFILCLSLNAVAGEAQAASGLQHCRDSLRALVLSPPLEATDHFEVRQFIKNMYALSFPTQYHVASTFLRFQEHYESPEFRGKVFTLNQFKKWYRQQQGSFSYYSDWAGFNIPSRILEPFYAGQFPSLDKKERSLLEYFRHKRHESFYLIATLKQSKDRPLERYVDTVFHETAHALFYLDPEYKKEVLAALATVDTTPLHGFLKNYAGYHPEVWDDETHAWLLSDFDSLYMQGVDIAGYEQLLQRLNEIFARYFKKWKI